MELRDFAEQLLYSPSLEKKLFTPETLTDSKPGLALATPPAFPARPDRLLLNKKAPRARFPSLQILHRDEERAKVMHFLANHELLALELMALTLLRFPKAPGKFRLGVAQTILEEQTHLRLYLKRMNHLSMEFGDIPLNDFFWKRLAGMQSPMDYVTGLSLTFEQCNLDFSAHYQDLFTQLQDEDSRALMERVYLEEIGHVKHGLFWFDQWRDPEQSRWKSYLHFLPTTLQATRAKGQPFSHRAREAVGLDQNFIENLEIYAESKGKSPDLYFFNPLAEIESVQTPPQRLQSIAEDLETCLFLFAGEDDIVLLRQTPSVDFLTSLSRRGFKLPQICLAKKDSLKEERYRNFKPWAWSPSSQELLQELNLDFVNPHWNKKNIALHTDFFDKAFQKTILKNFLVANPDLKQHPATPYFYSLSSEFNGPRLVKPRWGASGRGFKFLKAKEVYLPEPNKEVVEPYLQRQVDLSLLFLRDETGKWQFKNCSRFETDAQGKYLGHFLKGNLRGLPSALRAFLSTPLVQNGLPPLKDLGNRWQKHLNQQLHLPLSCQALGIDFMVIKSEGHFDFHYLCEINPRFTFGHVALALEKKIKPQHYGYFQILPKKKWTEKELQINSQNLLIPEGVLLTQGILPLADPSQCKWSIPVLEVFDKGHESRFFS